MTLIVVDTNVFVGALLSPSGANREVLRRCLMRKYEPLMGAALLSEMEDTMKREELMRKSPASPTEREALLAAFLSVCRWTNIYYLWRPNLPDESDNHLVELAVAGGAEAIVTNNVSDFVRGELKFPALQILTPVQMLTHD
jgi:uncharacterized protein